MKSEYSYLKEIAPQPDKIYTIDGIHVLGSEMNEEQAISLYQKQMWDDYAKSMDAYRENTERINERIFKAIRNVKGEKFEKDVREFLKHQTEVELIDIEGDFSLTKIKRGGYQEEDWGSFKGIFVEQWSVGMEGDSWNGNMYIKLKKDKYLKIPYSC